MSSRYILALAMFGASACVQAEAIECADGRVCGANTTCRAGGCVTDTQVTQCRDLVEGDPCAELTGTCFDGACLPKVCGNGRVDFDEACDDRNATDGDGCSASCRSTEVCGNGVLDLDRISTEACDDGNVRSHDGCTDTCAIERPVWTPHTQRPVQRTGAVAANDARRGRIVMFGGNSTYGGIPGAFQAATLEWDGAVWIDHPITASPLGRSGGGMAYDADRGRSVLFGGEHRGLLLGDLWEWDGAAWSAPFAVGPGVRGKPVVVYDARRHRTVVWGGVGPLADTTWEWDGTSWLEVATPARPPVSSSAAGTYDPIRGVVVVFVEDRLWDYDGMTWRERVVTTPQPPPRTDPALAFEPATRRLVLYGGTGRSDTWVLDGDRWTQLASVAAGAREGHVMVPDASGHLVMFGGSTDHDLAFAGNERGNVDAYTWHLGADGWSIGATPIARYDASVATGPTADRVLVFGGRSDHGPLDDTWAWTRTGWENLADGPEARGRGALACDLGRARCTLFGGDSGATVLGDTWTFEAGTWTLHAVDSPTPRTAAAMAFDPAIDRVVLFGGSTGTDVSAETWSWDGTSWTELASTSTSTSPPPRSHAALAFDPTSERVILFGGLAASGDVLGDTWAFDGTSWTAIGAPQAGRRAPSLAWDASRRSLVLAPDLDWPFSLEWDGTSWRELATGTSPMRSDTAACSAPGGGIVMLGGSAADASVLLDGWTLRWEGALEEACSTGFDTDGDGVAGCADPDCGYACSTCGNAVCDPAESCRSCPADCTCEPVCGDLRCDLAEVCPGDCP